jgi:hypothetical protein
MSQGELNYDGQEVFTNPGIGTPFIELTPTAGITGYRIYTVGSSLYVRDTNNVSTLWTSTGPTGAQGPRGYQGTLGPGGPTGVQGVTGYTGPAGVAGTATNTGATGSQGTTGSQGITGSQGFSGVSATRGVVDVTTSTSSFSVTGGYTPGNLDLFQNGVKLISGSDFTATNGSSVALSISVPSGTVLEYIAMGNTAATTIGISPGVVAAPSISSSYDLSTGFYFPASGSVAIANTGVQSFIANSSGNIGIGIGSPTSKLHVVGNTNLAGTLTFNDFTESVVVIGNSATAKTIALTNGTVQTCTLTGNCTFTMPTATAGKSFTLFLSSGAGSFTATFTSVKWSGGTAPVITTTASKVDILSFISDGTSWYGAFSQNY